MYEETLTQFGLTKNESKIYETLLKYGKIGVGKIATEAYINRRNVYDSLDRLVEKGLIFEIRQGNENLYQPVDPNKLKETLEEKQRALDKILPDLTGMYLGVEYDECVSIYRGIEGWKNYMRDILRAEQDLYSIGAKGAWVDKRINTFLKQFMSDAQKKNIKFFTLFDQEVKETKNEILEVLPNHRFLPEKYSTKSAIDIFGDHVVILSVPKLGIIDDQSSFTVIVNQQIADSFRCWFQMLWDFSEK